MTEQEFCCIRLKRHLAFYPMRDLLGDRVMASQSSEGGRAISSRASEIDPLIFNRCMALEGLKKKSSEKYMMQLFDLCRCW